MADKPNVDDFMRHLQVCIEEARTIPDGQERENRLWQLEAALQEAIIYQNRVAELQRHGIDPKVLVEKETIEQKTPAPYKVEALMTGQSHCTACNTILENDLDFCPECGQEKA